MPCTVCTIYVLCCTVYISIDTQESQDQSNVCILYLLLPHDDGGKVHAENNGMAQQADSLRTICKILSLMDTHYEVDSQHI
jgi:hypothetical protein